MPQVANSPHMPVASVTVSCNSRFGVLIWRRMADSVTLSVDGAAVTVPAGAMVSAAVAMAGVSQYRRSVSGEPRGPLCGMGICFECRVTIDGRAHSRSCQVVCQSRMEVRTDG